MAARVRVLVGWCSRVTPLLLRGMGEDRAGTGMTVTWVRERGCGLGIEWMVDDAAGLAAAAAVERGHSVGVGPWWVAVGHGRRSRAMFSWLPPLEVIEAGHEGHGPWPSATSASVNE